MECEIVKCETTEYESELTPTPVESDLVQVYDSIEQITNPNSNHIYVVGNDIYVFDGTRFLHTNECNIPPYDGEYTVTAPSYGDLVLPTKDMLMTDDLKIEANHELEDALITNQHISEYVNDTAVGDVVEYTFYRRRIDVIRLNKVGGVRASGFQSCEAQEIYVPSVLYIQSNSFRDCQNLKVCDIGKPNVFYNLFQSDATLETLIIRKLLEPSSATALQDTKLGVGKDGGYVYVPQAFLAQYQSSQAWQDYANVLEFRAIEGSIYELEE